MSKFDAVFAKTPKTPEAQNSESPNVQTAESLKRSPKPTGRPPGKKSDPAYRQVTVYLPIDLHDRGRDEAVRLSRSKVKAERRDFSGIVEGLLRARYEKSESSEV